MTPKSHLGSQLGENIAKTTMIALDKSEQMLYQSQTQMLPVSLYKRRAVKQKNINTSTNKQMTNAFKQMNLSNNIKSQYLTNQKMNKTIATNTSEKPEEKSPSSPDKIRFGSDLEFLLN